MEVATDEADEVKEAVTEVVADSAAQVTCLIPELRGFAGILGLIAE
jgi:hypothetical protein